MVIAEGLRRIGERTLPQRLNLDSDIFGRETKETSIFVSARESMRGKKLAINMKVNEDNVLILTETGRKVKQLVEFSNLLNSLHPTQFAMSPEYTARITEERDGLCEEFGISKNPTNRARSIRRLEEKLDRLGISLSAQGYTFIKHLDKE